MGRGLSSPLHPHQFNFDFPHDGNLTPSTTMGASRQQTPFLPTDLLTGSMVGGADTPRRMMGGPTGGEGERHHTAHATFNPTLNNGPLGTGSLPANHAEGAANNVVGGAQTLEQIQSLHEQLTRLGTNNQTVLYNRGCCFAGSLQGGGGAPVSSHDTSPGSAQCGGPDLLPLPNFSATAFGGGGPPACFHGENLSLDQQISAALNSVPPGAVLGRGGLQPRSNQQGSTPGQLTKPVSQIGRGLNQDCSGSSGANQDCSGKSLLNQDCSWDGHANGVSLCAAMFGGGRVATEQMAPVFSPSPQEQSTPQQELGCSTLGPPATMPFFDPVGNHSTPFGNLDDHSTPTGLTHTFPGTWSSLYQGEMDSAAALAGGNNTFGGGVSSNGGAFPASNGAFPGTFNGGGFPGTFNGGGFPGTFNGGGFPGTFNGGGFPAASNGGDFSASNGGFPTSNGGFPASNGGGFPTIQQGDCREYPAAYPNFVDPAVHVDAAAAAQPNTVHVDPAALRVDAAAQPNTVHVDPAALHVDPAVREHVVNVAQQCSAAQAWIHYHQQLRQALAVGWSFITISSCARRWR